MQLGSVESGAEHDDYIMVLRALVIFRAGEEKLGCVATFIYRRLLLSNKGEGVSLVAQRHRQASSLLGSWRGLSAGAGAGAGQIGCDR